MKYFIDTEFHEHKRPTTIFGLPISKIWTIDLISIGIVAEDGREYYAINRDLNLKYAKRNEWLLENVISLLPPKNPTPPPHGSPRIWDESRAWKSMKQIKKEIIDFIYKFDHSSGGYTDLAIESNIQRISPIEFYAYFADYDWVVFCWLFGRMIDLPKGFPMWCRDLKQMMRERGLGKEWKKKNCPDPEGEHNALVDARWNLRLFNAITK